ncbi:MAG: hypothetical protein JNL90_00395 [Planctomycetes bacterium]|nr:hypothetical protein [Planctomycetota bacterium]
MFATRWKSPALLLALLVPMGALVAAAPLQEAPKSLERQGTLVPAEASEVKLALESWSSPLELLEVVAHGTPVRAGDLLARCKLDPLDEALAAAERDLRSTEIRHQNAREQARLEIESADVRLADAAEAIEDAEKALALWEKTELELKRRGVELNDGYSQDNLEDQRDELAQLEKMYTADELTDATEEIVLKRARRQLARSEASYELQKARRRIDEEVGDPQTLKQKKRAVRDARNGRDRLVRQLEMEKRSRDDSLARLEPEMKAARERVEQLRRDRERLTLRAPQAGVVLHGALDDYKPGRSPARHQVGGQLAARGTPFTVAKPGAMAVALDLPESHVLKLPQGMAVTVKPAADGARSLVGRLRFDRFPSPRTAGGPENGYEGTVELDGAEPSFVAGMRCTVVIEVPAKGGT